MNSPRHYLVRCRKILAVALAAVGLAGPARAAGANSRVRVEMFVMSHCPYGIQAENAFLPVIKTYEKQVDLLIGFIGDDALGADKAPKYSSMHGDSEVRDDFRQLCATKLDAGRTLDFILERNKNVSSEDWQSAAKAAGIDADAIKACAEGPKGAALFSANIKASRARQAFASPTVYVDNQTYSGPRTPAGMEWAVCGALRAHGAKLPDSCVKVLAGPAPAADAAGGGGCAGGGAAAAPVAFGVQVVSEKCPACAPTMLDAIKNAHPAAVIHEFDASSKEGQALIAKHHARALPLYVFDRAVENESNFRGNLDRFYAASAGAYVLRAGPETFDSSVQLGRKRVPHHADIFVEPLAPGSNQLADELLNFLRGQKTPDALNDLTLSWHFVLQAVPVDTGGSAAKKDEGRSKKPDLGEPIGATRLTSARGDAEVQESLTQVCLFQHESFSVFASYLRCRFNNSGDVCLQPQGEVKTCIEGGEGEKLLRDDAALSSELEVHAPALLWENRYGPFPWNSVDWESLLSDKR